jgi:hypothetical protein
MPTNGQNCSPAVGCNGQGSQCLSSTNGNSFSCAVPCTTSADCPLLVETCQPQATTGIQGNSCQADPCSDYFGTCNSGGNDNDGSCRLPASLTDVFTGCPGQSGGCGECMQGGGAQWGQSCDSTRGSNFCTTGSICLSDTNGGGNSMCAPMCSPWNGPTLCPYGFGCYWPIGSNAGVCLLPCPIDPLCPFSISCSLTPPSCSISGDTQAGCGDCNLFATLISGGTLCVMDCPGSSSCQFIPGTPIPACLP